MGKVTYGVGPHRVLDRPGSGGGALYWVVWKHKFPPNQRLHLGKYSIFLAFDDGDTLGVLDAEMERRPKVLVACEFSGIVRDAFIRHGCDAVSCDVLPSETVGPHRQEDVLGLLGEGWDLLIAHPPCTHLASSGARWFKNKVTEQVAALDFVRLLLDAPILRIALENPVGVISSKVRRPEQIIQPWQFGHGETKATCLWLKDLPLLRYTQIVPGREARIHRMSPSPERWRERSRTYSGIADAMASQWSPLLF